MELMFPLPGVVKLGIPGNQHFVAGVDGNAGRHVDLVLHAVVPMVPERQGKGGAVELHGEVVETADILAVAVPGYDRVFVRTRGDSISPCRRHRSCC